MTMSGAGVPFALAGKTNLTHFVTMLESKCPNRRRYARPVRGRERTPRPPVRVNDGLSAPTTDACDVGWLG